MCGIDTFSYMMISKIWREILRKVKMAMFEFEKAND